MRTLKSILVLAAVLAFSKIGHAQLAGYPGNCMVGGQQALTQGLGSTGTQQIGTTNVLAGAGVMASFPFCSVSVYVSGTITPATIFSNSSGTPLSSTFIANFDGSFQFWAATGACYDIALNTGTGPALPYPVLLAGVCLGGSGGGGGGITLINTTAPVTGGPITTAGTIGINNATTVAVGVIELAGDLGGLATAPTVVNGSNITNSSIKNSGLVNPSLTITPGTGLSGGGAVALGASVTLNLANQITAGTCTSCNLTYNAQGQITVATNGSSGGSITGLGTTNKIPVWTSSSSIGNSGLNDNGTSVFINNGEKFSVSSATTVPLVQFTSNMSSTVGTCTAGSVSLEFPSSFACVPVNISMLPATSGANVTSAAALEVQIGNNTQAVSSVSTAVFGYAQTGGASVSDLRALMGVAEVDSSGAVTTATGVFGQTYNLGNTTAITNARAVYAVNVYKNFFGSAGATNSYGVYVDSPDIIGANTIVHQYGVYVADQTLAGGGTNSDPWAIFTAGTAKSQLGGALTVTGTVTLSSLASAGIQCVHASTTGILSGTGSDCGSGGSGSSITVNGGAALGSPTDFRNGTGARIVNGITIQFANPTGNEVEAAISGQLTNAGLQNSTITLNGTANQITSPGSTALGGTATFAIANPFIFPGKATLAASTTSNASLNIPAGSAPTGGGLVSGALWNLGGIVQFYDGVNTNSFVTIQGAVTNGFIPKFNGISGLIGNGYSVQGTDAALLTSGTIGGAGLTLCTDSFGGATTLGCSAVISVAGTANQIAVAGGTTNAVLSITSPFDPPGDVILPAANSLSWLGQSIFLAADATASTLNVGSVAGGKDAAINAGSYTSNGGAAGAFVSRPGNGTCPSPAALSFSICNNGGTGFVSISQNGGAYAGLAVLGSVPFDNTGLSNPTASSTFTQLATNGWTLAGTAPASTSSTGTAAGALFTINTPNGGATTGSATTAGTGGLVLISLGNGGSGAGGTNAIGGQGGGVHISLGGGGASGGTAINSNGGDFTITAGVAGVGGSSTAGRRSRIFFDQTVNNAITNSPRVVWRGLCENAATPTFINSDWSLEDIEQAATVNGNTTLNIAYTGCSGTQAVAVPTLMVGGPSAGTLAGTITFFNATSGSLVVTPPTGALSGTLTLPNATGTFAVSATSPITESAAGAIACATCVTSAASLTSTALMTGAGSQASQTPSATSTLDASGNLAVAAGGSVGSANTGTPKFTFATNSVSLNQPLTHAVTSNQEVYGTSTNLTTVTFPASSGAVTITAPNVTSGLAYVSGSAPSAGVGHFAGSTFALTSSLIVAADITSATITGTQIASSIALAGSPTTTTQSAKDNSTKIATTAYVDAPTGLTTGTSVSLTAPRQYFVCTSTCTITVPVPAAGYEFCVMNDDNVSTVITMSAIGSSARYENTARTAYGTAGTGTFVSGGAVGDKVCLLGRDSTHYLTASFNGTWTAN